MEPSERVTFLQNSYIRSATLYLANTLLTQPIQKLDSLLWNDFKELVVKHLKRKNPSCPFGAGEGLYTLHRARLIICQKGRLKHLIF